MARLNTKAEMLEKLRSYTDVPDDDNIRFKQLIKDELLSCPELLYALHDCDLESELFDENGNVNYQGEWDRYFGENSHIRPYLFFPDVQTDVKHYLCYKVDFDDIPRYNNIEKYGRITFTAFCNGLDAMDVNTGIPRHDLIISIIRELFNWGNVFSTQCKIISDKESVTDNNYVTRTIVFELTKLNSVVKTSKGVTGYINK